MAVPVLTVRQLIDELEGLIKEDPSIADLDVYTWVETEKDYEAEQAAGDSDSDIPTEGALTEGAIVAVVVPSDIDKDGRNLGSYVVVRGILLED